MIEQGAKAHRVTRVILHCSATRPDWMQHDPVTAKVEAIRIWHKRDRGWSDIGYHWVVDRDGRRAPGRPERIIGAHVKGWNRGSIGICLIGGHGSAATDCPEDHFTTAQLDAARKLVTEVLGRAPGATVHGHNEFAAKACPGFKVADWWYKRKKPRSRMEWGLWDWLRYIWRTGT